ncbi:PQQ-binding-like beta-propeller repeat protein [Streptomyces sp. NPDC046870]|uniref:outer membrane protein assembly factor BamB family protein n=1 Tax=Streptomyces sp. NPDC046870 TaxID=3155135 RepID=UPI003451E23B
MLWGAHDVTVTGRYLSLSDRLFVAADDHGRLHTFFLATGKPKWTAQADAEMLLIADAEAIYLLTKDRRLRAQEDFGKTIPRRPVAHQGRPVMSTSTGHVVAVNKDGGRMEWTAHDPAKERSPSPPHGTARQCPRAASSTGNSSGPTRRRRITTTAGRSGAGHDNPILRQGHGVRLLDQGAVPTVSATRTLPVF